MEIDNIRVLLNDKNRGKGYSVRRGFSEVKGDIAIIQDADLEYYPDEYGLLIGKITDGKADVVYGSRFMGARRIFFFYHYLGNKALNTIANILYNTYSSDLMTGYKAFRADIIKRFDLRANRFGIEAEITAQVFKRKLRVYEVPVSYNGRSYDEGKKITWFDFFHALYWLFRCRLTTYDMGENTLYSMRLMKNNNKWIFDKMSGYIGNNVLEIGSGIGNISKFIISMGRSVIVSDIKLSYIEYLKTRFSGNPKVKIVKFDAAQPVPHEISSSKIDTVTCINVLEHIEDDKSALNNINGILEKDGRLILLVPAFNILFGETDKQVEHKRRYGKKELKSKLESSGFEIELLDYHNLFSTLGWFINGKIFRRPTVSSLQATILDKLIPIIAFIERIIKIPFGLSLFVICRKK